MYNADVVCLDIPGKIKEEDEVFFEWHHLELNSLIIKILRSKFQLILKCTLHYFADSRVVRKCCK